MNNYSQNSEVGKAPSFSLLICEKYNTQMNITSK